MNLLSEDFQKYFMAPTHDNQDLEIAIYNAIKKLEAKNLELINKYSNLAEKYSDTVDKFIKKTEPQISDELIKTITTHFYYHWRNSPGTNTEQGFDEWWKVNKPVFIG